MQVTAHRDRLARALHHTLGVVDRQGHMPILGFVLLQAEENQLRLSATDLETSYRGACEANVEKPGALAVPARHLHDLVKSLAGDEVLMVQDSGLMEEAAFKEFMEQRGFPTPEKLAQGKKGAVVDLIQQSPIDLHGRLPKEIADIPRPTSE